MTYEKWLVLILGGVLILIVLAVAIPLTIADYKKNKDKYGMSRERIREIEDEQLKREPKTQILHATVIDMACGVKTVGYQNYRQPKAQKNFVIIFQGDHGERIELPVSEEFYEGFDIGLAGVLTLVDGQLNSFEPDDM